MTQPVITDLRQEITNLLQQIARGGRADNVADALRARQIRGYRQDTCSCPIANLIKTHLPNIEQVDVVNGHIVVWENGDAEPYHVTLPIPVSNFIFLYDEGVYLDLVELPGGAA